LPRTPELPEEEACAQPHGPYVPSDWQTWVAAAPPRQLQVTLDPETH
jgi:hypothetical protein